MRSIHAFPHDILGLEILQLGIRIFGGLVAGAAWTVGGGRVDIIGAPQGLIPADGATRRQGHRIEGFPLVLGNDGRRAVEVVPLAAIANDILILVLLGVVVVLALATSGAEETLLALAPAAHARGVMGVIDAA